MYVFTAIGSRIRPTFAGTPITFNPLSIGNGCNAVQVQALTQHVRMSWDATAQATASDGMRITAGNDPKTIVVGAASVTFQQEASGALFYMQPGRVDWIAP